MIEKRQSPIEISQEDFKKVGHQLVDAISNFIETINENPVTTGENPKKIQQLLGNASLPDDGIAVSEIVAKSTDLVTNQFQI